MLPYCFGFYEVFQSGHRGRFFLWEVGESNPRQRNGHFVNLLRFFLLPMTASRSGPSPPVIPLGTHARRGANLCCRLPFGSRPGEGRRTPVAFVSFISPVSRNGQSPRWFRPDRHGVAGVCHLKVMYFNALRPSLTVASWTPAGVAAPLLTLNLIKLDFHHDETNVCFPGSGAHPCAALLIALAGCGVFLYLLVAV